MIRIIILSLLFINVTTDSQESSKNIQNVLHVTEYSRTGVTACSLHCFDRSKGLDQPKTFILPGKYSNNSIKLEVAIDTYKKDSDFSYSHPCQIFQFCVSGNFSGKRFDHYLYGYTISGFIDIAPKYYSGMSISTITVMPLQEGSLKHDDADDYDYDDDCVPYKETQPRHMPESVIKEGCKPIPLPRYDENDDPTCIMYWDHSWDNYCNVGFFNSLQSDHNPLVFPLTSYSDINNAFHAFQSSYCRSLGFNQSYSVCVSIGDTPFEVTYHSYESVTVDQLLQEIKTLYGEDAVYGLPFRNITIMARTRIQSLPLTNNTCIPKQDDADDADDDDDYELYVETTPRVPTARKKPVTEEYNDIFSSFDNFDMKKK
ncbi:hypothetical protein [Fowlpox virus]|uniref:Uncharacterized protein n=1 Tax=Fowlpox virus TaxID=10261 RepID=A0A891LYH5_FOWPV|nr:hypothetical protein [Fowlpox virus]UNS14390.1 ALPV-226 [Albatrosspox virus]